MKVQSQLLIAVSVAFSMLAFSSCGSGGGGTAAPIAAPGTTATNCGGAVAGEVYTAEGWLPQGSCPAGEGQMTGVNEPNGQPECMPGIAYNGTNAGYGTGYGTGYPGYNNGYPGYNGVNGQCGTQGQCAPGTTYLNGVCQPYGPGYGGIPGGYGYGTTVGVGGGGNFGYPYGPGMTFNLGYQCQPGFVFENGFCVFI